MKKCLNCKKEIKDEDNYCYYCGIKIRSNNYYVFIKVLNKIMLFLIILMLLLLISSYMVG